MNKISLAWRVELDMLLAAHADLPFSRFVQVATVRADGRPANRTLTFRFFMDDERLLFTADARTEKMEQIDKNPWAELCWYFTEARVQMRLLGKMARLDGDESEEIQLARRRTWQDRTNASRQSFTWPAAGSPLSPASAFECSTPDEPPSTFAMLAFSPERVETLDLARHLHERTVHIKEAGRWQVARINP